MTDITAVLAATAAKYDATGEFPADGIRAVHAAGLLTATVSPRYGGSGAGVAELARILLALGRGDPSVALIASMTLFPHLLQARNPHWPTDLYASVLAHPGPVLLNNCRVEPELGSPARGGLPATTARRTADGWSISGRKRFVTGAAGLTYFLVWAATDEPEPRVGTFVVPGETPGIEVVPAWDQLGLRASGSHDVSFTEVAVPLGNVLNLVPANAKAQQDNLAGGALHLPLAALYVGVGRAAQEAFHRFAHERMPANLGRPVATTDRFKAAAGEIEVLLSGAERLIFDATERLDAGAAVPGTAALGARVLASRHAVAAVTLAVRLLGNPGLSRNNPLERHFRDVQSALVHAPQEDTALLNIGSAVLAAHAE